MIWGIDMLENIYIVSIIIPVYNSQRYLRRSIESVLNQTYVNWELILVDDGSQDKSVEICEKYSALDSRIRLVKGLHAGASGARNLGIKKSRGQFLMFVDSDDCIAPDAIENMMTEMDKGDIDLCVSGYDYFNVDDDTHIKNRLDYFRGTLEQYLSERYIYSLENSIAYTQCSKMYKRELIEQFDIKFSEKYSICEDALFVNAYLSKCKTICVLDNTDYIYFLEQNISLSKTHQYGEYIANSELYLGIKTMLKQMDVSQNIIDRMVDIFFVRYFNFSVRILWSGSWRLQKKELKALLQDEMCCEVINASEVKEIRYMVVKFLMKKRIITLYMIIMKVWNFGRLRKWF